MSTAAPTAPIRVLLVDDHRTVLWGLAKLIESGQPQLRLAGTATSRAEALRAVHECAPDVVLLDWHIGEERGGDVLQELGRHRGVRAIVLSGVLDEAVAEQAVRAGACGLIHKSEPAEVILNAIARVHEGALWVDRSTLGRLVGRPEPRTTPAASLTRAERRVVAAVVRHRSAPSKAIADALCISAHTLRNHLASIYDKLGVPRRLDLVLYALEHRLDRDPD